MRTARVLVVTASIGLLVGCADNLNDRLATDRAIVRDLAVAEKPIPASVLRESKAVLVLDVVNVSVGIGFTGGGGTMVRNLGGGRWSAPLAMSVIAGTIGPQLGGEGRSMVLVLNDEQVIDRVLSGDAYPLAGAGVVAGPAVAEANHENLPAPSVYTYSKSGGLYLGASLGGLGLTIDEKLNQKVYGDVDARAILSGTVKPPPGALAFTRALDDVMGGGPAYAYGSEGSSNAAE